MEGRLVGNTDSGNMFCVDFPLKHTVDTVQQVQFESSSYTSVDVHISPLPSDLAVTPPTMTLELRPETPVPATKTTTPSMQQTLPDSYPEIPVPSQHLPLIEVPSPTINMQDNLEVSDQQLGSERDSDPTNPIPGSATPPHNASIPTPSASKSSKTALFEEVPETHMLDY